MFVKRKDTSIKTLSSLARVGLTFITATHNYREASDWLTIRS